ncbi:cold shock and DUF1294 domain-containing protein [Marinobacter nanhaiticus D15-8W]|uniref:DUF1294 domain-containing protein n=1 Tax=Marinobacter nanhaiticus D15-8W TaxID=626887 RepID=N6VY08_9GAMM|nr:cold shock and DUF1294 domain-containing protein [Marinobacter nanhaiticus]ENO12734.1 DUF1294 domain-containing protein [Marinobacter nanhaiticus D15-8W]BES70079.1 cold shock and DUF1294 domain-containing protein [Marinobacter nanhaiticus D15-8W]
MNQRGTLTTWNDAKGFGFITPETGGDRVFAHISSYAGRGRPVSRRKVTYSVAKDGKGRLRAGKFQYVGAYRMGAGLSPGVWLAAAVVLVFFAALAGLFYRNVLPASFPGVYSAISLVLFLMYWIDKRAATRGAQRTPKNTLHLLELLCGWPGALLAQQVFRHKTRKGSYQFVFWLAVLANLGALGWLLIAPEASTLRQQLGIELPG